MHDTAQSSEVAPAWAGPSSPGHKRAGFLDGPDVIPYFAVLLFLLTMYSVAAETVPLVGRFRPAMTLGLGALAFLVLERTLTRRPFRLSWPDSYALLGFFGAAALSSFSALWPGLAVQNTIDLAKLLVLYLLIVNVVGTRKKLRGLLWTLVLVGFMPAFGTIQNFQAGNLVEGRAAWIGRFGNPNILACELTILVPLAVALMASTRWRGRLVLTVLLATYIGAIYFTFSRSGLIALGVIVVVGALRMRSPAMRTLVVVGLMIAVVAGAQFWEREQTLNELHGDTTFNQRLVSVQAGLAMFQSSPAFGVGVGCSHLGWQAFAPDDYSADGEWLMIHNTFVQALAETGIVGFIMLMIALLMPLWRMRVLARANRKTDPEMHAIATAIELSLLGLMVSGLANGYMESAAPYLLIALATSVKFVVQGEQAAETS
jgi:O-antigen ligase